MYSKQEEHFKDIWYNDRCGSRICVRGGPCRDFADIAQRNHDGGKNLGLKMGGQGGEARAPRPPLDPHLNEIQKKGCSYPSAGMPAEPWSAECGNEWPTCSSEEESSNLLLRSFERHYSIWYRVLESVLCAINLIMHEAFEFFPSHRIPLASLLVS